MSVRTDRDVVDRYTAALGTGDFETLFSLLADDVVEVYPQSGERFRGRESVRALWEQYPGGEELPNPAIEDLVGVEDRWVMTPVFTVVKIAGGGQAYTLTGRITYPNQEEWHLIQLLRVGGGGITHVTSYFAPPFEPADWRAPHRDG
ncbi:MAG: nuclear transport factor 2 family protein [Chloroflexota bacterium]